jgi:thiamine-phosphate pyrophosphorylase
MIMIVITCEHIFDREAMWINALFGHGLDCLHVRKPHFTKEQMYTFISKIDKVYHSKVVLHQHHDLAADYSVHQLHFATHTREISLPSQKKRDQTFSTSTHSIKEFNELPALFDYAFLSPVYRSISKPDYYPEYDFSEEIKLRSNFKTRLVALGGVKPEYIASLLAHGFDDIALLGSIWNDHSPLKNFQQCQVVVPSL